MHPLTVVKRLMPRGRRFTLAPPIKRALWPSPSQVEVGDAIGDEEWRRVEGREALSRTVAWAAEACRRPSPVHGVSPIRSKFWAGGEDSEDDEPDVPTAQSPSTPEFVKDAMDAGFTIGQLIKAKQVLSSGKSSTTDNVHLPSTIISTMVKKKLVGTPWQGPLPAPRVSPPRTLGDFMTRATHRTWGLGRGSRSSHRRPRSPASPSPACQQPVQKNLKLRNLRITILVSLRYQAWQYRLRPRLSRAV
jgi:hypothetical protein